VVAVTRDRLTLLCVCITLLASCGEAPLQEAEFFVFGTRVQVSLSGVNEELANRAFSELQQRFQSMHRNWHAWEPGKLTEVNQAFSTGASVTVDAELEELVRQSQQMETRSGGRFNAAIGQLIGLWGFHTSEYPILGPAPAAPDIAELVSRHPSARDIDIIDGKLTSRNPAVQLDFGGIAKGYAADLACDMLKHMGVENALVSVGGDIRAFGMRGSRPWRIAIRNPAGGALGSVEIRQDEAVSTSGNYERFRETPNHERLPHVLDPRSGLPALKTVSATVIAGESWLADAAATTLLVAGVEEWPDVEATLGIDLALIVDENGKLHATPGMLERMEFTSEKSPAILPGRD
jgi:thiamine biosynthesis lipoprotein